MDIWTLLFFFLIALVYSSAGFGGGSLYLAVLGQQSLPVSITRTFALVCNALVTSVSIIRFSTTRVLPFRRALRLIACSSPFVVIAASQKVSVTTFYVILGAALLIAALAILAQHKFTARNEDSGIKTPWLVYPLASIIGVISGLTGIGGGVYLSPLLYLTRWGTEKEIASTCSLFIAVNSLAGLTGLLLSGQFNLTFSVLYLLAAVLLGGLTGSYLAADLFHQKWLRYITVSLLIFAGSRILYQHL